MMCPNCGAEMRENVCSYCGSKDETVNKLSCEKCGGEKIKLQKQKIQGKSRITCLCEGCGNIWFMQQEVTEKKASAPGKAIIAALCVLAAVGAFFLGKTFSEPKGELVLPGVNRQLSDYEIPNYHAAEIAQEADDAVVERTISLLESSMKKNFDYAEIEYRNGAFVCYLAGDGVGESVLMALLAGYDETYSDWMTVKSSLSELCGSMYELAVIAGMDEDLQIVINVIHENNFNDILLTLVDGVVTFDAMAD